MKKRNVKHLTNVCAIVSSGEATGMSEKFRMMDLFGATLNQSSEDISEGYIKAGE